MDLDTLDSNIAELARHIAEAGVHWRPHMKGVRVPAIALKAIAAGAIGVTCATIREAEAMAKAGVKDILTCATIREAALEIGILIDVNTGMNRTGLPLGPKVIEMAQRVNQSDRLNFLGIMSWEGHALALEDADERERETKGAIEALVKTAESCRSAGLDAAIVSGGGSGTYMTTPFINGMTEIQAGGAIFCDVTYQSWGGGGNNTLSLCSYHRQKSTRAGPNNY